MSTQGIAQNNMFIINDTTNNKYPYIFPFLGQQVYEKGFDLPLPVGIMVNYFMAEQDVDITEIAIGLNDIGIGNDIPLTDITRIIDFEKVTSTAYSINVRPDLWILPFLNIYGVFGKSWSKNIVKISYPFELETVADLDGESYGFGFTGASGIGNYFMVLDGNMVWTNMKNFTKPVISKVFSSRIGRTFKVGKSGKSSIALWAGAMKIKIDGNTEGYISIKEIIPEGSTDKVVNQYKNWYDSVDPFKQKLADKIITPIVENINNPNNNGTIHYKADKEPHQEWNMIIGGQYEINKEWQVRTEAGIIGNRKSFLLSGNYRFGL